MMIICSHLDLKFLPAKLTFSECKLLSVIPGESDIRKDECFSESSWRVQYLYSTNWVILPLQYSESNGTWRDHYRAAKSVLFWILLAFLNSFCIICIALNWFRLDMTLPFRDLEVSVLDRWLNFPLNRNMFTDEKILH